MRIAVASGKGGTGKTTVAVSLFHFLEIFQDKKVQLVDCDVEEPNDALFLTPLQVLDKEEVCQFIPGIDLSTCTFCKKCVEWCEFNAITVVASRKFAEVDSNLCHSCGACSEACPTHSIVEEPGVLGTITHYKTENGSAFTQGLLEVGSAMQTMLVKKLKSRVRQNSEITIFDSPPGTSCSVVETVSDTDYVILVSEPTPFGLHDLKITVELLQELEKPFGVVVNKANLGFRDIYSYLDEKKIELLGEIPFSREFARVYSSGELLKNIPEEFEQIYQGIIEKVLAHETVN
ncbi:MinD superfamily P-loop ATPase, contains an inserted ferredoxin domain [Mariniphaga anaerophila]|uniref:MinD superfamily P-loop ATPase, contains an inserted ferredoxin domain n=1 Tax=Mariniphaga anaerophila TaxID=1484053 RepID=A0A1M4Y665_9BACT|nr:ATP-binding protein [Mariniphaga anaerophila]SHF01304.1 MinD superfamily P-loop ATPase, contains an inserted ferredoxin domain [Mariniphaga anaerophila]